MKIVPVTEAVGMVLCHDLTRIVPGREKGPAFRKGHIITPDDIEPLLDMGKAGIFVFDPAEGFVHEDTAASRIASAAAGPGLRLSSPCEGRINFIAETTGILDVNVEALRRLNSVPDVVFATLHTHRPVTAGQAVGGTRITPLVTREENVLQAETLCRENPPIIQVKPYRSVDVGIVTTGSEVFQGRIEDRFGPVLRAKFAELGCPVLGQTLTSDDPDMTRDAILSFLDQGAGLVAVTGGMSVDPDDRTPTAIRATGADVVTYGAPVFPGAMFLLAYRNGIPIVGLPGCVMYYRASVFDLVVPRILAGDTFTREDFAGMGHGGFCAGCPTCEFPRCGFGK